MSIGAIPPTTVLRDLRNEWRQRWQDASPANRTRVQFAVFVIAVLVAYHYSLSSLVRDLNLSTPLAYVGLVPAIALAMAATRARPLRPEPAIHDRQLDYIIGLPLVGGALAIELLLPNKLSAMFWVWRIDLLSMPFFVAGAVALLFGTRVLWRQKMAVGYLLLAWPLPYSLLLLQVLDGFTNLTIAALHSALKVVSVAKAIPGSDGSLFQITHAGKAFPLSVVSACSGVDGVVGFLLVGSAFAIVVAGPRLRKGLWLVGGILLLWVINLGRILFIFWAGQVWGEHVAIQILHPFVGLVTFSVGVVIMILAMGPLGLRISGPSRPGGQRSVVATAAGDGRRGAVPRVFGVIGLLAVVALVLGVNNTGLKSYDLVASSTGEAKLASFSAHPASPAGWSASYDTAYTWAQPYFGDNSTWLRYEFSPSGGGGNLHANLPVIADVVNTTDLESFSAYNVQACYNFHGYSMRDVAQVNLGGGIRGQALSYTAGSHGDWTIVYWIWPVISKGSTHYERVILYLQDSSGTQVSSPGSTAGITSLNGALDPAKARDRRLVGERTFVVDFARQIVQAQAHQPTTSSTAVSAAAPNASTGSTR